MSLSQSTDILATMTQPSGFLGIDLGTSNSAAAWYDGERVHSVRFGQSVLLPSVVRIDAKGVETVGERPRRMLLSDPENTRSEFKRLMGGTHALRFEASGIERTPEELSAAVLKVIKTTAETQFSVEVKQAVISVPALFELPQIRATSEAARLAGFERIEVIQEPIASALAAGASGKEETAPWLVYDLGGGTFDVSLIESRDGLLRVVGHDGDNFLGGKDFDATLLSYVLHELLARGIPVDPRSAEQLPALRALRAAVENAKIDLSIMDSVDVELLNWRLAGRVHDVLVSIDRAEYEKAISPLIDRTIDVCRRLLARHGFEASALAQVVLIGGPTATPLLRSRVEQCLGAPFGQGLDPMTLVSEGAARFAATANLPACLATASVQQAPANLWLQYPTISADLHPWIVGKWIGSGESPATVRLSRVHSSGDSDFTSSEERLDSDGTFVLPSHLRRGERSTFRIEARSSDGVLIDVRPSEVVITQGVTLGDAPLSRSIGVATADNEVLVFVERGAPLPARRLHRLRTVSAVEPGDDVVLQVPIVQGEFAFAHLCRRVGELRIDGKALSGKLPPGSEVELVVDVDRGGALRVEARLPTLEQSFEQVCSLVSEGMSLAAIREAQTELAERVSKLRETAFRNSDTSSVRKLGGLDGMLAEARVAFEHAHDPDQLAKAGRLLIDVDATISEVEAESAWPELLEKVDRAAHNGISWLSHYGAEEEMRAFGEARAAAERSITASDVAGVQRNLALMRRLADAAYWRSPNAMEEQLHYYEANLHRIPDAPKAKELLFGLKNAAAAGDRGQAIALCGKLHRLLPASEQSRALGYSSGVRRD